MKEYIKPEIEIENIIIDEIVMKSTTEVFYKGVFEEDFENM